MVVTKTCVFGYHHLFARNRIPGTGTGASPSSPRTLGRGDGLPGSHIWTCPKLTYVFSTTRLSSEGESSDVRRFSAVRGCGGLWYSRKPQHGVVRRMLTSRIACRFHWAMTRLTALFSISARPRRKNIDAIAKLVWFIPSWPIMSQIFNAGPRDLGSASKYSEHGSDDLDVGTKSVRHAHPHLALLHGMSEPICSQIFEKALLNCNVAGRGGVSEPEAQGVGKGLGGLWSSGETFLILWFGSNTGKSNS